METTIREETVSTDELDPSYLESSIKEKSESLHSWLLGVMNTCQNWGRYDTLTTLIPCLIPLARTVACLKLYTDDSIHSSHLLSSPHKSSPILSAETQDPTQSSSALEQAQYLPTIN
jgi:hypothetical protein